MKKVFRKVISVFVLVCVVMGSIPILGLNTQKAKAVSYENGQIIEFGSYPQAKVTDATTISKLDEISKNWISYRYMQPYTRNVRGDYMKYADLDINSDGIYDYRAVTFTVNRNRYAIDYDSYYSRQKANGYYVDEIYYFKYEPLTWKVLDSNTGLVMCEELIDARSYNDYLYWIYPRYWNDSNQYVNNWMYSDIRSWLNSSFYTTSFSNAEKSCIYSTQITNKGYEDYYTYSDTNDKVFLLSFDEMTNSAYGFSSSYSEADYDRTGSPTDYAKCQGAVSIWYLRSAGFSSQSDSICAVFEDGHINYGNYSHSWDIYGIRPALRVDLDSLSNLGGTFCGKLESSGIVVDLDNGGSWVSPVVIDGVEYDVKKNVIPDSIKDYEGQDVVFTVENGEVVWFSSVWNLVNKISCNLVVTDEITYSGKKYSADEINATVRVNSLYKGKNVSELKGISELGVAVSSVKLKSSNPALLNFDGEAETTVMFNDIVPIGGSASQSVKINVDSSYKISDLIEEEIVTISCEISAAGDGKLIEKAPTQKNITITNKNYEKPVVEDTEEPEPTDTSVTKAATELNKITSSVTIAPSTELEDIFTSEQIKAIGDLILCEAVMASAPADTFERVLAKDVISDVYGYSNGLFTLTDGSLTFSVASKNKRGEKVTVEFKCDYNSYLVGQVQGTIYYRITKPASMAQENYTTIGHISQVDISAFSDAAYALAESEIKNSVKPWGDKVDWATDIIFGTTVNKILEHTKWGSASGLVWDIITSAAKNVKIECPVDVYVYNSNDELVAAVEDNEVILTSDKAHITVNGDTKYVTLFDESYYIVYEATADGTMRVTVNEHANSEDILRTVVIDEIPLESGAVFSQNIDGKILEESDYSIKADDETVYTPDSDETTFHYHETDGEWFEGKAVKCTEDGWNYTMCNICGDWYKEIILCEGHTDEDDNGYCDSCENIVWQKLMWNIDGTETTTICKEGSAITVPENPEKMGYTFAEWTPKIPDAMPAEDLTFTATWTANSYNAVFDANGGKWADGAEEKTVSTDFDLQITAPENPVKQGYVFSCWSPDVGIMDSVDGKMFTAVWIPAADTRYTVENYIMNTAGEYEKSTQVFSGTTNSMVNAEYDVENGFVLNEEKSVLSGTVAADNSLVLKVYVDRNKYTLTTVVDGVSTETEYLYGSIIAEPAVAGKTGYEFVKWDKDIPDTMPANDLSFTAQFKCVADVSIRNNSGSKTINYGETLRLTAITANVPDGAKIYWYVDGVKKGDGTTFEVSPSSGSIEVTVKIADANENVLKDANGEEISDSQKVSVNSGLWQKIVSFFKNLFRINRTVIQAYNKIEW